MKVITVGGAGYWGQKVTERLKKLKHSILDISLPDDATYLLPKKIAEFGADAVFVLTPPSTHFILSKLALENDCDVFVEKPMTYNAGEAGELFSLSRAKQLVLHVDSTFLYTASFQAAKSLVTAHGLKRYSSLRLNNGPFNVPANAAMDLVVHDVAILFGLGVKIYETAGNLSFDNATCQAHFKFYGSDLNQMGDATVMACRSHHKKIRDVNFELFNGERYLWTTGGIWQVKEDGDFNFIKEDEGDALFKSIIAFTQRCEQRQWSTGLTDGAHGMMTVKALEMFSE